MPGWTDAVQQLVVLSAFCAVLSYAGNTLLMPVFRRYAMARPNARSSHTVPTPQGGGIAVVLAGFAGLSAAVFTGAGSSLWSWNFGAIALGTVLLAAAGAADDLRPLPVLPRIALQGVAAGFGVIAVANGPSVTIFGLPPGLSILLMEIGLVWFVNLSNFMDGIDGITIAEFLPILMALMFLALMAVVPPSSGLIAAALAGALAGFAPFNRHVARLFLGDTGSLAIGFVTGCLLLGLGLSGHLAAALILPLYYLADATLTLGQRWWRGERLTTAHRTHYYQRATDLGRRVPAITGLIARTNAGLAVLAIASTATNIAAINCVLLAAAAGITGWLLRKLSQRPRGLR